MMSPFPSVRPFEEEKVEEALVRFGEAAVDALLEFIVTWGGGFECRVGAHDSAFTALAKIGSQRATEPLLKMAEENRARRQCCWALGGIADQRAVEPLIKMLETAPDDISSDAVCSALGKIGDPRAVDPLIKMLTHTSVYIRLAAAEALGELGDSRAVEPLKNILSDEAHSWFNSSEVSVGEVAAVALRQLDAEE